jgi:hypothetical protein
MVDLAGRVRVAGLQVAGRVSCFDLSSSARRSFGRFRRTLAVRRGRRRRRRGCRVHRQGAATDRQHGRHRQNRESSFQTHVHVHLIEIAGFHRITSSLARVHQPHINRVHDVV